jgi:phage terminase large subunit-like protein
MILPAELSEEDIEVIKNKYPEIYRKYGYKPKELLFPERLTREFLRSQRTSQGLYIFNCNYMLNPVNVEESELKREWLRYYRGHVEKTPYETFLVVDWLGDYNKATLPGYAFPLRYKLRVTTTIDPAHAKKKRADNTGGSTVGTTDQGDWFILDLIGDKFNPREIVDAIFDQGAKFNPDLIGVEENGKETIKFYLVQKMRKLQKFFRLRELKPGAVQKEDRIRRLIPRFENKTIYLPTSITKTNWDNRPVDLIELFENEYTYFPKAKTDDILDCLAYQETLALRPRGKGPRGSMGRRQGKSRTID